MRPLNELLDPRNPRVLVAAHRGAWNWAPENSLAAIEEAIAHGADMVECDVRATADGVLVLLHDATLDRTTTARGRLAQQRWRELAGVRMKASAGGDGAALTSQRLPTLSQALECARDRIVVNIDTKDASQAGRVAEAVVAAGMAHQVFVKAELETPAQVDQVRRSPFYGHVAFVPILRAPPGRLAEVLALAEPLHSPMLEIDFGDLAELAAARGELARQRARLWVNTIVVSHSLDYNDPRALTDPDAVWGGLVDAGVGAIQTDEVPRLVDYLASRGLR